MAIKKALIGAGGHSREVMAQMGITLPCFVDDEYAISGTFPLSSLDINEYQIMITIANPLIRRNVAEKLSKKTKFFTFIHPTVLILDKNTEIREGSFIGAYSILTTNIKIGKHALLNRGNHIGHDSEIGDYFSAMPGSIISGNTKIGSCVYLGTNSSIKEKLSISELTTIGMNSCVVKNIEEPGIYVGVPTKKIKKL